MRAAYSFMLFCLLALSLPARALDAEVVRKLATGESDEQVAAVAALVAEGDAQASALLQALADGQLQTSTLADYLMPSAAEFPSFELDHVEDPADNATGARGVGEGGTLGAAAALANAVSDALGIDVDDLPLSPESVFRALARRR